jgi:broad specificity phosphatase PhoE
VRSFTLHVVRHGESEWNLQHRVQGQSPDAGSLTEHGIRDARAAGLALRALEGAALEIVTSDLPRAFDTARIIAADLGLALRSDPAFREQDLGIFEGRNLRDRFGRGTVQSAIDALWRDPTHRPRGGESVIELSERVIAAVSALGVADESIVVAHGGVVRALFTRVCCGRASSGPREVENASITSFAVTVDAASGQTEVTHLPADRPARQP